MRILQILEKNQFNTGSVHQMFQAAVGLSERGHDVEILSRPGSEIAARASAAGLVCHSVPFRHELDIASLRGIRNLIVNFDPDVIHVHKGLSHSLALAATWSAPVPAFVVNRGVSFELTVWNRAKYRTKKVDRIVTVCEDIRDVVIRTGKVEPTKVEVVYAGTDVEMFDPSRWSGREFRKERSIPDEAFLLMQVGVREWKGWRILVDAFAELVTARPDSRLALVAYKNDDQRRELERYASDRGIEGKVIPIEYRDDMPRVLMAADCVVDASWSGTGVTGTIREGMALAKPVVATSCGGNGELVSTREMGWLVPPRDREALTRALEEVMDDRERAAKVGRRARGHIVDGFSKAVRIRRLESLYTSIINSKASA